MIDMHSHILPGVDDGSKDMDETLQMAKIAVTESIHYIIATPHYIQYSGYKNKAELQPVVDKVNATLQENNIKLTIGLGHEVYLTPDLVQLVQDQEVATLNDSRYLLIEFPMNDIPTYTEDIIYELKLIGITPIIAHPERYPKIIEDPNLLIKYIELGALCQANAGSINGLFGSQVQETVWTLIEHQMIHFVATDAHSTRRRAPFMQEALSAVTKHDAELAKQIFMENPFKVYSDLEIEIQDPLMVKKQSFMSKLFGKRKKIS